MECMRGEAERAIGIGRRAAAAAVSGSAVALGTSCGEGGGGGVARGAGGVDRRQRLLDVIASASPSSEVSAAISDLVSTNSGLGASDDAESFSQILLGTWRLLWSSDAAEVSRFTRLLPNVFTSFQLIGAPAGLEKDRAANVVSALGGGVKLKLSSSARMSRERFDAIIIGPPFVFELLVDVGGRKLALPLGSESSVGSDESPLLGSQLNVFTQLYVERSGGAGDLRISKVTDGDAGVVGAQVHLHRTHDAWCSTRARRRLVR